MDAAAFIGDDEGALKLTHVLGVDAEIRLHRHFDMHAFGDVNERTSGPDGGVEGREFVVGMRNDRSEILLDDFRVFPQAAVHVQKQDTLGLEVLSNRMVNGLGFVLRRHPAKPFLFGFGDAQAVEGVLDVFRNVVPIPLGGVGGTEEVGHVVEVDAVELAAVAPVGHLAFHEVVVGFDAKFGHPFGLVFEFRDVADHLFGQAFVKANGGVFGVVKTELVVANRLTCIVAHVQASLGASSHSYPSLSSLSANSGPPDWTMAPSIIT